MCRPLVHLLIAFALLLQGVGSAWAASRMAAGEVQVAAHVAELPPCHQEAAQSQMTPGGNCCGAGLCHCAMACAATPALPVLAGISFFPRQAAAHGRLATSLPQTGYRGLLLRPPAALPS